MTSLTCPGCGQPVRVGWKFCGSCRTPLSAPPAAATPAQPAPQATPRIPFRVRIRKNWPLWVGLAVIGSCCMCGALLVSALWLETLKSTVQTVVQQQVEPPASYVPTQAPAVVPQPDSGAQPQPGTSDPGIAPLAPLSLPPALSGQYQVVDPDGNYLVGTITFADGAGCYDGCGSFSANITPREVQAMDDGTIVFHFQIDFLEVSGNPYFRQEFLNATMYINNVEFKPTGSSLPSQVTPELVGKPLMGYLTFPGRILAVDPANSPEYSFRLEIPLLNQPLVGGWLKPKS